MTTLVLAVLAVVLAGPVSSLASEWTRMRRSPLAAMIFWQALALAAVLAALGAGLSLATWGALRDEPTTAHQLVAAFAGFLTVAVIARLLFSGHLVGTELRRVRRRHRELVDLLGEDVDGHRVLEHGTPAAWCLPGFDSRVVISQAALEVLDRESLAAVLRHERSHLRSRHDLVIEAFTVLHRAIPFGSSRALTEVTLLVEVLADRAAIRETGRRPLVLALSHLAGSTSPDAALAAASEGVVARLEVLRDQGSHRVQAAVLFLVAVGLLVLPTVLVALPWLRSLA